MLDQKWLADGSAVLVLDAGEGAPGDDNYRPALVARLATEQHEPAQVLDSDPLEDVPTATGPTATGSGVPGEMRGAVAPQAATGPAAATVVTRSTAAEDPNVTQPGGPATGGIAGLLAGLAQLSDDELNRVRAFFGAAQPATAAADAHAADAPTDPSPANAAVDPLGATGTTTGDTTAPAEPAPVPAAGTTA